MKKFKFQTITIEGEDGTTHTLQMTSLRYSQSGEVTIVGQLTDQSSIDYINEPLDIPKGKLRPTMWCSALVRFNLDGVRRTAAITHTTCRAWRIINLDLGVAWVPANAFRWSESSKQFILDPGYEPDFTTDVAEGMMQYPYRMEAESEELRYDYKID